MGWDSRINRLPFFFLPTCLAFHRLTLGFFWIALASCNVIDPEAPGHSVATLHLSAFSLVPAVTAVEGRSGAQSLRGACRLECTFFVVIELLLLMPQHACMGKPAVL